LFKLNLFASNLDITVTGICNRILSFDDSAVGLLFILLGKKVHKDFAVIKMPWFVML